MHPSCRHQGQDPNSNLIIKKRSIGRLYRLYVFTHSQQPYRIAVYLFSHSIHLVYGMELEVTTNHHAAAATASKTLTASEYIQCTGSADEWGWGLITKPGILDEGGPRVLKSFLCTSWCGNVKPHAPQKCYPHIHYAPQLLLLLLPHASALAFCSLQKTMFQELGIQTDNKYWHHVSCIYTLLCTNFSILTYYACSHGIVPGWWQYRCLKLQGGEQKDPEGGGSG